MMTGQEKASSDVGEEAMVLMLRKAAKETKETKETKDAVRADDTE